ncbi:MAG: ABC transporter permease [Candidatus Omnitrophica bacterium]|nr:ABC transporter permease [Candidatus Omnitrophota bacterium]
MKQSVETAIPEIVIQPSSGWSSRFLKELWSGRELLYFLVWRDIKVRYKQTALGAAWAVLQPFLTMVVFSIFFGQLAKVPSDGIPYPIFAYCALLPWQLFAFALTESSNSLVANQNLVTKVYFPRMLIPIAAVVAGLVDFMIAFVILIGMMFFYGTTPTPSAVALPLFVVMVLMAAFAIGIWLSALNVKYRDVRYTIPFLTQLWLFLTPIAYPASLVPDVWRPLLGLNPMAGVVEGFRWALLGTTQGPGPLLWVSIVVVLILLVSGIFYFKRTEKFFADII